jgi:ubiquinol-cytochrome c reductase iron-sulfur subunit
LIPRQNTKFQRTRSLLKPGRQAIPNIYLLEQLMATDNVAPDGRREPDGVDKSRRRMLTNTMGVVGAVGAAALAIPLVSSMSPSARARAAGAPVEVDISKLEDGQRVVVEWRGKPVWVVKRTPTLLEGLKEVQNELRDVDSDDSIQPEYAKNEFRSIKPEILVMVGICTHLGCSPSYRPEIAPADLGGSWKGGFFCPCHGSRFDISGRVYKGVPAPTNLDVPPHYYMSDTRILVGEDGGQA